MMEKLKGQLFKIFTSTLKILAAVSASIFFIFPKFAEIDEKINTGISIAMQKATEELKSEVTNEIKKITSDKFVIYDGFIFLTFHHRVNSILKDIGSEFADDIRTDDLELALSVYEFLAEGYKGETMKLKMETIKDYYRKISKGV